LTNSWFRRGMYRTKSRGEVKKARFWLDPKRERKKQGLFARGWKRQGPLVGPTRRRRLKGVKKGYKGR